QFVTNLGGDDIIRGLTGDKRAFGGDGNDQITFTTGDHVVIGDNGMVTYVAMDLVGEGKARLYETTDDLTGTGGIDVITLGDGNNTVLGGMGGDTIDSANGTDTILGDNGFIQRDIEGNNFALIATKSQSTTIGPQFVTNLGGDDIIRGLTGDKRAFGGDGNDQITFTTGDHVVFGDNGMVTYVAMDLVGEGKALLYETTDILAVTAGNDAITLGDGNNTVLGGLGVDIITTSAGNDTILGDNGFVQMDAEGNNFAQVVTNSQTTTGGTITDLGGNDVIIGGTGDKTVLGGDGTDAVTMGTGNHTVLGDNGAVTYVALGQTGAGNTLSYTTTDTVATTGGGDTVTLGDGNNVVLTGTGSDTITTGTGTDTIVGDGGTVTMDASGSVFQSIDSTMPLLGGNDVITSADGTKTVLGGVGADTVSVATGTHYVTGDNASLTYYTSGVLGGIVTTNPGVGDSDVITAVGGDTVVLAGVGNDSVTTGEGKDALLGDNGIVGFDGTGILASAETTDPLIGGDDFLSSGNGSGVLIGGSGADNLLGGTGQDLMMGDSGWVSYSVGGVLRLVETLDPMTGTVDQIDGGGGQNVIFGGAELDMIVGNLTNDILAGDYGSVMFDPSGFVTSFIRYSPGTADLIAQVQEELFTYTTTPSNTIPVGTVYVASEPNPAAVGTTSDYTVRLSEFVTLSSISGYEFTHNGDSVRSTAEAAGQTDGAPETQGGGAFEGGAPEDLDGTSGGRRGTGGQRDVLQGEGSTTGESSEQSRGQGQGETTTEPDANATPPAEDQGNPQRPRQTAPTGSDELPPGAELPGELEGAPRPQQSGDQRPAGVGLISWDVLPAATEADPAAGRGKPMEMLLAGLLGAQSWYSRVLEKRAQPGTAESGTEMTSGDARRGQWLRTAHADQGRHEVLLDRRARPRPESDRKLPSGAIEKTAQKWMDSGYGLHSSVQNTDYGDKIASRAVIDWGGEVELPPIMGEEIVNTAELQKPN
ncbi:MAG: hypothetical protein U1A72_14955, partial [Sulfuritalea sp.]|nr:hypothetical protein [Sulfuritalea sp.]